MNLCPCKNIKLVSHLNQNVMFNRLFANHRVKSIRDFFQLKKKDGEGMKMSPNFLKVLRK